MISKLINQFKMQSKDATHNESALSCYNNGLKMAKTGHYSEALQEFKKSSSQNPKHPLTYYQLGCLYFQLNQFSDAKRAYKKFFELNYHYNSDSEFDFESGLDINSINAKAYNDLGIIYQNENNFIKAIGAFRCAIRSGCNKIEALINLGFVYFKMGAYQEALKAFKQVLNLQPDNIKAYYGMGLVFVDLGNSTALTKVVEVLEKLDTELAAELTQKSYKSY